MELRLVDKWRGVTFVPTKGITDPFEALAELRRHTDDPNKQAVFEADAEFMDAMKNADPESQWFADEGRLEGPCYQGIPFKVIE